MSSYTKRLAKSSKPREFIGWDGDSFALPDKIISKGSSVPSSVARKSEFVLSGISSSGTVESQISALRFFNDNHAFQFAILSSLGAPGFIATGKHGALVNLTGGIGKTTCLKACASLWGDQRSLVVNWASSGIRQPELLARFSAYRNLPLFLDDLSMLSNLRIKVLCSIIPQGVGKVRSKNDPGKEPQDKWDTVFLSASSERLYKTIGDAGSKSMELNVSSDRSKKDADEYIESMQNNYGHIGPLFVRHIVDNKEQYFADVKAELERIESDISATGSEGFWTAATASAIVAGRHAKRLKLIDFDVESLRSWVIEQYIPTIREEIKLPVNKPFSMRTFLKAFDANTLVVDKINCTQYLCAVLKEPTEALMIRHEIQTHKVFVRQITLKGYCMNMGYKFEDELKKLEARGAMIKNTHGKYNLGQGTPFSVRTATVIVFDARHPLLYG